MGIAGVDVYVEAFIARCGAAGPSGIGVIHEPGICGLSPRRGDGYARLLVTDDRARDRLATLVSGMRAGMITVCAAAAKSAELLENDQAWRAVAATAMICRDLRAVKVPELPGQLTVRPVQRLAGDGAGGVPLTRAVAAACRADPESPDPRALADHLRSLPRQFALWVAVDREGAVRGTSGSAAFGTAASVIFVNTDPAWRRRGVARSMTAVALAAAERSGARHAGLDASSDGSGLYVSLGFEAVTPIKRFRPGA